MRFGVITFGLAALTVLVVTSVVGATPMTVAAGLESHTKKLDRPILIDEYTRSGVDDGIFVEPQGELVVKGKTRPVIVYAVQVDSLVAKSA
jgi:class 3 adenylate cyclase